MLGIDFLYIAFNMLRCSTSFSSFIRVL
jgi:hypothetical protein